MKTLIVVAAIISAVNGQTFGEWLPWGYWSTCSVTCNDGFQTRLRDCTFTGGMPCVGDDLETRPCFADCAGDGGWSIWLPWSTCCHGYAVRLRDCSDPKPGIFGRNCTGSDVEAKHCQVDECNLGNWETWGPYGACSVTCGQGIQKRWRICLDSSGSYSNSCSGSDSDVQNCTVSTAACPVDGGWSIWSPYGVCSCKDSTQTRLRTCTNPVPHGDGRPCPGSSSESRSCAVQTTCPLPGNWGSWLDWSHCIVTCGVGVTYRVRKCDNPPPQNGGDACQGVSTEFEKCTQYLCSTGTWNNWGPWDDCSATCGSAVHFRFRNCTQSASLGPCVGNEFEIGNCTTPCPVAGFWGAWSRWRDCSVSCEFGYQTRSRLCDDPPPQFGGPDCNGEMNQTQVQSCDMHVHCPRHGNWGQWSYWTVCDVTCNGGRRFRLRKCDNPTPLYGGNTCPGQDIEQDTCNMQQCLVSNWENWGSYGPCSVTCGKGIQERRRICLDTSGSYSSACPGSDVDVVICSVSSAACPDQHR